jgi:hypothetical protein
MILLSEFFKIWGAYFGIDKFEPELSFDERVYYQVTLMQSFVCYEEIKSLMVSLEEDGEKIKIDDWRDFLDTATATLSSKFSL